MDTWKAVLTAWVLDTEAAAQNLTDGDKALALCAVGIYRQLLHGYTRRITWISDETTVSVMLDQADRYAAAVGIDRGGDDGRDAWRIANAARGSAA